MIRIEESEAGRLCTCCRGRVATSDIKEIVFSNKTTPTFMTVALCKECRKELKNVLIKEERHERKAGSH